MSEVACDYSYTTPECQFLVTGRFQGGEELQQRLFAQFDRDEAGNLVEVIVIRHERRR